MELLSLQLIQGLVQDPHLSRVASRFHLGQSALSKKLQSIEEEIGIKLFDRRGPRGLEPTPAAKEIAGLSEQVLTAWNAGMERVKRHQDQPTHFGIVGPQVFMREVVLPWWISIAPRFPELSLETHISGLSKVSFELVQAGMDVGILEHKEDLEDFICKPIFTETWGVVAHPKATVNLEISETLKRLSWGTLSSQNNPVAEWLVRRQKMPPPRYHLYWNDMPSLVTWITETASAASVLPLHSCQAALDKKRVQFISLGKDSQRILYMAYRQNHPHKKLIQQLLEIKK